MTRASLPDDVLIRAALLGVFDPRELLAPEGAGQAQDLAELAALSVETAFGPLWLWTLTEDARRAGLTLLPPPGPSATRIWPAPGRARAMRSGAPSVICWRPPPGPICAGCCRARPRGFRMSG